MRQRGEAHYSWDNRTMHKCEVCGKDYRIKASHAKTTHTCSRKCHLVHFAKVMTGKNVRPRVIKYCKWCGKEIQVKQSHAAKEGSYCSKACMTEGYREVFANMTYDRIDANQEDIVSALRAAGATVVSLARMKFGCPDLCVGYRNTTYLLEIKMSNGSLTPAQVKFFDEWRGHAIVVRSAEEALKAIGAT